MHRPFLTVFAAVLLVVFASALASAKPPADAEPEAALPEVPEGWVADQNGCLFWNPHPVADSGNLESVQWDGPCEEGYGSGSGTLIWLLQGEPTGGRFRGIFVRGKLEGEGAIEFPSGARYEGGFRDGLKHGHGVQTFSSGRRFEGEFERGEKVGDGTYTAPPEGRDKVRGPIAMGMTDEEAVRIAGIFVLITFVALYVYMGLTLWLIARKMGDPGPWMAWVPIANIVLMCRLGGRSGWWTLAILFVPIVNLVLWVLIWIGISHNRGKPAWLGAFSVFGPTHLVLQGYLAFAE